jgi:hypothetical protein
MTMVLAPDRKAQAAHNAQQRKRGGEGEGELAAAVAPSEEVVRTTPQISAS